ncbi:MAG: histidine kinase, partial [Pyrinomonadaceae bacterium]|nr:histidine kinase [Pyrinomonadaceae bacterium]
KRITQVTKDMMNFARARPAAKASLNVNEIIEKGLRLASFDKSFQKLSIHKELSISPPSVFADADQLQQVFLNILLNARDAMPSGGILSIKSFASQEFVTIEIGDTGAGIEESEIKQIFDPFFTTKSSGKGTGLGLAVCYGIITTHDGMIDVVNNDDGGTTFSISLPNKKSHKQ